MISPAASLHGPALIGIYLAAIMYGICLIQTYNYFQAFPKDKKSLKYFVAYLFLADTLNTVFIVWWLYDNLITHFGDAPRLIQLDWLIGTEPAMNSIVALSVQLFFAYRVRVISGKRWLTMIIVATSFIGAAGGIGFSISFNWAESISTLASEKAPATLSAVWLGSSAASDILITTSLTYHLHKSKIGAKSVTETILNRVMRLTVQNGLLTTTIALIELCLFLGMPHDGLHIGFNFPLLKIYTISVLSSLHSRRYFRKLRGDRTDGEVSSTMHGVSSPVFNRRIVPTTSKNPPDIFSVEMDTRLTVSTHGQEVTEETVDSSWLDRKMQKRRDEEAA